MLIRKNAPSKVSKAIIRMLSCEEAVPTEKEIQFILVICHFRQWLFTRTFVLNVILGIDFKLLLYKNAFRANPPLPWCVWALPNSYAEDWPVMWEENDISRRGLEGSSLTREGLRHLPLAPKTCRSSIHKEYILALWCWTSQTRSRSACPSLINY